MRRAFLCGVDPLTSKDYEHRKGWIRDRLEEIASFFAIEVCGYAVMSNHLHLVLRSRPDLVRRWTDEEVALQWRRLFPARDPLTGLTGEPTAQELSTITSDPGRVTELRKRLASLSWFMRCLNEPIARAANQEDGCTGRFWEGRFRSQALVDEAAILACSIYVDLNPIRAGIAETPENSQFTSAFDRIRSMQVDSAESPNQAASEPIESPTTEPIESPTTEPIETTSTQGTRRPDAEGRLQTSTFRGAAPDIHLPGRRGDSRHLPSAGRLQTSTFRGDSRHPPSARGRIQTFTFRVKLARTS